MWDILRCILHVFMWTFLHHIDIVNLIRIICCVFFFNHFHLQLPSQARSWQSVRRGNNYERFLIQDHVLKHIWRRWCKSILSNRQGQDTSSHELDNTWLLHSWIGVDIVLRMNPVLVLSCNLLSLSSLICNESCFWTDRNRFELFV